MELTQSWARVIPSGLQDRYEFIETRNAAAVVQASHPTEFQEVLDVLAAFRFDLDRILRSGGSKHLIARELDEAFREFGWREARYEQELSTRLVIRPYKSAGERRVEIRESKNEYGGHLIDNVKGRIGLDVEWNPKDGNLDRDFANFRALYNGGALDAGILIVRKQEGMRQLWIDVIARAKKLLNSSDPVEWQERVKKIADDPLGTSTTSNFEKLRPRMERGDGGGCPVLAIAITDRSYDRPADLDEAIKRLVLDVGRGVETVCLAQRMGLMTDNMLDQISHEIYLAYDAPCD